MSGPKDENGKAATAAERRRERLAEELRANLVKRKQQSRARAAAEGTANDLKSDAGSAKS